MSFTVELLDPVVEFILEQPIKMQAKIQRAVHLMEQVKGEK